MYKKMKSGWIKHLDFILIDLVCMELSFLIAYIIKYGFTLPYKMLKYRNLAIYLLIINLIVVLFNESYKNILKRQSWQELKRTTVHVSLIILICNFFLFVIGSASIYSKLMFVLMWGIYIYTSFAARTFRKWRLSKSKPISKNNMRSLIIVASKDQVYLAVKRIVRNNYKNFYVKGICVVDEDMCGQAIEGVPVIANRDNILKIIRQGWTDEIFFNISDKSQNSNRDKIINACCDMGITVHICLAKTITMKGRIQTIENIAGYSVVTSSLNMASEKQLFIKRLVDILGGFIGTIITGILCLFIAPVIYIKSPGPIFFVQQRIGRNGKKFNMYKFRTMYMDAEKRKKELLEKNTMSDNLMFKIKDDPRIIGSEKKGKDGKPKGIGNFLRRTSLDEFPQFLNVLKGDMSLIGTRPPTVDEWKRYKSYHRQRMSIKPGITGLWQISGRSNITDFDEILKLDVKYIKEWNLFLDFKILLKTILSVLKRDGSL